ncbi:BREX-1 system adenine-specific DNA-methyltransferase PglX [Butyrivibrio fibrisolvens]|uniref:BREX-1 system adenine-specific DNA-methyltransferase PglX n=1 Tax=Butyrivibrio fibrisolvens TaxID=831 RepID=UPI0003B32A09|nr:BREX-1 system adenine-specific DNA-methyltransferase PglX [Butyrivibrio fibrisolvens]
MDKTAIRNFAIEARKILMKSAITEAGFYGITKEGCKDPVQKGNDFEVYETVAGTENRIFEDDIKRRANLVQAIKTLGFEQVIEETAYTWFNRIIAIRFMEVNNYLPTRVRVLSSETGSGTPDIITQADTVELNLTSDELEKIQTAKRENRYDDAFRMLFIKQCNELNAILPGLFEKTDDYMELLLKITYTGDGVIRMLVDSIPEDNFNVETEGQVEIIGWMYQYYNTELKDDTFAKLKKNVKITKERIPAATQLFTPDWIVRYMVENSLGRVWIEHLRAVDPSVDEKAKAEEFGWKYYLPEAEQEDDVQAQLVEIRKSYKDLTPQDITCIDPCMGSGHILVYMFDVLMDIYRSEGFSEREAVFDVLEKNIRGLDIDRRAYQLSYFALMMKARGYNRIFFRGHEDIDGNRVQASPKVYAIEESNSIDRSVLQYYGAGMDELQKNNAINQINGLLDSLNDAKEYGSILHVDEYDWKLLRKFLDRLKSDGQLSLLSYSANQSRPLLNKMVDVGETLARKYDVVVTNPPYMVLSNSSTKLNTYAKKNFPDSKSDLFAVFIERCHALTQEGKYYSMITQHAWMFLASFEEFRKKYSKVILENMVHLGSRAFDEIGGEVVQTTAFTRCKSSGSNFRGTYIRLISAIGEKEKESMMLQAKSNGNNKYIASLDSFMHIPGMPVAYWSSKKLVDAFENGKLLDECGIGRAGLSTGNNDKYMRLWFEPDINKVGFSFKSNEEYISSEKKYVPCNKGGSYRKWYGNNAYVLDWSNPDEFHRPRTTYMNLYYRDALTWSVITSDTFSCRYYGTGYLFDHAAASYFSNSEEEKYNVLCLLNSKVAQYILSIINPTLNTGADVVLKIPVFQTLLDNDRCRELAKENISLCKADWDAFEISWEFMRHPFLAAKVNDNMQSEKKQHDTVKDCFNMWDKVCQDRFDKLKANEEELNKYLINAYGLEGELNPSVDDEDISVRKADLARDVRSFISYAVGCMFGRYSLDKAGLVYAGGSFSTDNYQSFNVDEYGIIPITDEHYFEDDIVSRFEEFLKVIFGIESLEENLDFVADVLGTKGNSSREKIRNYFLNDFYRDHCATYSVTGSGKRPIYWLFDSGKQNGFKCLIYLHRYTPDTVGLIRSDYLTRTQSMIENALKNAEYAINTSSSAVDRAQATKKRDKYIKQLAEIRAYYPALSHIALQRIELDLDDGVKANYELFQGIEVSAEGEKKQRINLLAKI